MCLRGFEKYLLRHEVALLLSLCCCTLISAQGSMMCTTPDGKAGTCISLTKCDGLLKLLLSPSISDDDLRFLKRSECGFVQKQQKVCCRVRELPDLEQRDLGAADPFSSHRNRRLLPTRGQCGEPKRYDYTGYLVGGKEPEVGKYPWMALLNLSDSAGSSSKWGCGGALINDRYVLTAAHCIVNSEDVAPVSVRLGEHRISAPEDCNFGLCAPQVQDIAVEETIVHPDYHKPTLRKNDIALIRLKRPAVLGEYVMPTCLPFGDFYTLNVDQQISKDSMHLWLAGWGATENTTESDVLLELAVPLADQTSCRQLYKRQSVDLGDSQFCAGGVSQKDSCAGDSGGPIMISQSLKSDGRIQCVTVGIVSFGPVVCGIENFPAVYTYVPPYMNWILNNIKS